MSIKPSVTFFSRLGALIAMASFFGFTEQIAFADYAVKNLDVNEGG